MGQYLEGHFTFESRSCQVKGYGTGVDFEGYCKEGRAAKWLLIPDVVLAIVLE